MSRSLWEADSGDWISPLWTRVGRAEHVLLAAHPDRTASKVLLWLPCPRDRRASLPRALVSLGLPFRAT